MSRPYSLRVSRAQVLAFSAASHDRNPLHLDAEYCRRTAFGQPVVFGMLGAMASFAALGPAPAGWSIRKASIAFLGPLFEDRDYQVFVDDRALATHGKVKLTTEDGGRVLVRTTLQLGPAEAARRIERPLDDASAVGHAAARRGRPVEGERVVVAWAPASPKLDALAGALGLEERGIRSGDVAALMAASYLVGMELPGEDALFARAELQFGVEPRPARIEAEVVGFDDRVAMASLRVDLGCAVGQLDALVRPRPVAVDTQRLAQALRDRDVGSGALASVTAVLVGGARGIGAALALALARSGAAVVLTYLRSDDAAREVARLGAGRVVAVRADAGTAEGGAALLAAVAGLRNGSGAEGSDDPRDFVDLLVLSAGPAATPLRLAPSTAERARAFVDASLAAFLLPLGALAEVLSREAVVVGMSSAYVTEAPPDFSHYAAAKGAVEGLLRAYAGEHPGRTLLLARPPRVLTDVTNTPFGKEDVLPAEQVAAAIVRAVVDARRRRARGDALGPVVVDDFGDLSSRRDP